jgi:glycosyltransferase involved in cell wall biosynthesis
MEGSDLTSTLKSPVTSSLVPAGNSRYVGVRSRTMRVQGTLSPFAERLRALQVVCITRLVYRKGVDLMVEIIPEICQRLPHVNFIVGMGPVRRT